MKQTQSYFLCIAAYLRGFLWVSFLLQSAMHLLMPLVLFCAYHFIQHCEVLQNPKYCTWITQLLCLPLPPCQLLCLQVSRKKKCWTGRSNWVTSPPPISWQNLWASVCTFLSSSLSASTTSTYWISPCRLKPAEVDSVPTTSTPTTLWDLSWDLIWHAGISHKQINEGRKPFGQTVKPWKTSTSALYLWS